MQSPLANPLALPLMKVMDRLSGGGVLTTRGISSDTGQQHRMDHVDYMSAHGSLQVDGAVECAVADRDVILERLRVYHRAGDGLSSFLPNTKTNERGLTNLLQAAFEIAFEPYQLQCSSQEASNENWSSGHSGLLFVERLKSLEPENKAIGTLACKRQIDTAAESTHDGVDGTLYDKHTSLPSNIVIRRKKAAKNSSEGSPALIGNLPADETESMSSSPPTRQSEPPRCHAHPASSPQNAATSHTRQPLLPLAVLECSQYHGLWWDNFRQGIEHLSCLKVLPGGAIPKPALLFVITYESTEQAVDDPQSTEPVYDFQIGVFLCWKGPSQQNMSLLERTKTRVTKNEADGLLCSLSNIAAIALCLQKWNKIKVPSSEYEYLGPNCCKASIDGKPVQLRCYDSRTSLTERKPDMYFNREFLQAISNSSIDPTVNLEAQATVVYVRDSAAADQRDFGESEAKGADPDDLRKRLWDMCGHFLIIQVPYHVVACPVKAHTAQSIVGLKCMVDQVLRLHSKGFVHGDLRPLNYVGTWIDFDISGKCGTVTFPVLFQRYLPDIYRLGKGRAFIRPYHDIHSLANIVLENHNFSPPLGLSKYEEKGVISKIYGLTKEFQSLASFERRGTHVAQVEEEHTLAPLVARLSKLLDDLTDQGWECSAGAMLLKAVEDAEGERANGCPNAK